MLNLSNDILSIIFTKMRYRQTLKMCRINSRFYEICFHKIKHRFFKKLFDVNLYKTVCKHYDDDENMDEIMICVPGPIVKIFIDDNCNIDGMYMINMGMIHNMEYKSNKTHEISDIRNLAKYYGESQGFQLLFFIKEFDSYMNCMEDPHNDNVLEYNDVMIYNKDSFGMFDYEDDDMCAWAMEDYALDHTFVKTCKLQISRFFDFF